ncbi:hypothetical protein A2774_03100 [Candidatus Roizmanbacteria bacterium RIFCSPHIGHO2_01_FULL_39_12c]|uniref:Nucleotidyl transferase domain-containing protein n=1 Tax=Candidatus Roizmanbacteria bacterium RIFCSPHIGHO2_01_FULL_39_12c TaxID=1802031 RepID=A0A1F7GC41_9BACT|nr:MAG: hypothetical protein A2774_03100 [Candidatus Roizmanbacteria bacterium RIFCSPHIGHO2_01_FULL_39_12c]
MGHNSHVHPERSRQRRDSRRILAVTRSLAYSFAREDELMTHLQLSNKFMQAVILSAGKGRRLYPLTKNLPKVMFDVDGKPLLEHHVLLLKKNIVKDIYINLYTYPERITSYFADGNEFGVKINYSREDTKKSYRGPLLLGSAGALHNFKKVLRNDFFVLYGDVFIRVNLRKMLAFHKNKNSLFTLAVHQAKHPEDSDLLTVDKNRKITEWIKTPHAKKSGLNSAGLYILNEKVFDFLPEKVPFDFAHDFIPLLLKKIPLYAYHTKELMMDIGTPERYNQLIAKIKDQKSK